MAVRDGEGERVGGGVFEGVDDGITGDEEAEALGEIDGVGVEVGTTLP